ncbi:hypothetical protein HPP92_004836 [Vanilla planifolia]|uniref:Glucan endo-1,3-beta-D-glucosidase n=1 Tax=Vanilla planifolia TaxID=51239 RepID=A0A835RXG1_VANPL|nr:hypothetical protein HPP92_004836 [Vanilla planifolia]
MKKLRLGCPRQGGHRGDEDEISATVENAKIYNRNLVARQMEEEGTPLRPKPKLEVYLFALFNEDLKPGPTSERNYGLYQPDGTMAYNVGLSAAATSAASLSNLNSSALRPSEQAILWFPKAAHNSQVLHYRTSSRLGPPPSASTSFSFYVSCLIVGVAGFPFGSVTVSRWLNHGRSCSAAYPISMKVTWESSGSADFYQLGFDGEREIHKVMGFVVVRTWFERASLRNLFVRHGFAWIAKVFSGMWLIPHPITYLRLDLAYRNSLYLIRLRALVFPSA